MIILKYQIAQLSNGDISIRNVSDDKQECTPLESQYATKLADKWRESVQAVSKEIDPSSELEHIPERKTRL